MSDDELKLPADEGVDEVSRRIFVQHLTFFGGGVVLLEGCKEPEKPKPVEAPVVKDPLTSSHQTFTDAEWATLVAVVDRILPKDQDAGGVEAGVPEYIDRMLQSEAMAQMKTNFVPGVAALDRRAQRMFQKPFAQCTGAQQDELISMFKNSPEKSGEARWSVSRGTLATLPTVATRARGAGRRWASSWSAAT
jgi:gluconate 2-dehydrogenase gamma chain